jgi:hypothetical protein
MFLTSLHHLQCFFSMYSIANALFKSTLKLFIFYIYIYIKEKIKINKGTKSEKKKVEGLNCFSSYSVTKFTWRPQN